MSNLGFYRDNTIEALSGNWVKFNFGFTSDAIFISNDHTSLGLQCSHDGGENEMTLYFGEDYTWDEKRRSSIYLRTNLGVQSGVNYRLSAWKTA